MHDGSVSGEIRSDDDRPEGKTVGHWKVEDAGDELWFSGDVADSEIAWESPWPHWPTARDGVQLWLDLRPASRFADINVDRDFSDLLITVRDAAPFLRDAHPVDQSAADVRRGRRRREDPHRLPLALRDRRPAKRRTSAGHSVARLFRIQHHDLR